MRVFTLIATSAAVAATAAVGGLATGPAVQSSWYAQLRKPAYQPPRAVFPVVWPVLYADIAVVSAATTDRLVTPGTARRPAPIWWLWPSILCSMPAGRGCSSTVAI